MMKNEIDKYLIQYKELFSSELFINSIPDDLNLDSTSENFVFGEGNPNAEIVFIVEAFGEQEDSSFIEKSDKLLDKILSAIYLNRDDVYILNIVNCIPSKNINSSIDKISKYDKLLRNQLKTIKPSVIIALGEIVAQNLLNCNKTLSDLRNEIYKYQNIDLLVTYHPADLIRNPSLKKDTWEDFKTLKRDYINA